MVGVFSLLFSACVNSLIRFCFYVTFINEVCDLSDPAVSEIHVALHGSVVKKRI